MFKEDIKEKLNILSEREREIINMRYGLDGQENKTLEEVGAKFNITRERVRQLEKKALEKLKEKFQEDFGDYLK